MASETADFTLPNNKPIAMNMGGDVEELKKDDISFDSDDLDKEDKKDDEKGADRDAPDGDGPEGDAAEGAGDEEEGAGEQPADLGAFDPADPEVVAKFDKQYLDADGDLDIEGSLSKEFWANAAAGKEGLNEATYEYLKAKGIKPSVVKGFEAQAQTLADAQKQSVAAQDGKLFEIAGGPDALAAALEWGKKGGYSKEQQERFNKATAGKDFEAKQEAVEALMARYRRANPPAKPTIPQRDATKGQGKATDTTKPFKDRAEMKRVRDALHDNDKAGWASYNRRRAITKFPEE